MAKPKKRSFEGKHPDSANYPKPRDGAEFDITPPGFCWWRVVDKDGKPAPAAEVKYRLRVLDAKGEDVYRSPLLGITADVPTETFPPGAYTWTVDAVARGDKVVDRWPKRAFKIRRDAHEQPWIPAKELLARVPREHPRCIFLKKDLPHVRETLKTTRKEAFAHLMSEARRGLKAKMPKEPTFGEVRKTDEKRARMIYHPEVGRLTRAVESRMNPMALAYVLTGEKQYGEKAKRMLMEVVSWDPAGVTSLYQKGGHGPSLRILRVLAQTYDWLYDLLNEDERAKVKANLIYRGNEMLQYLRKHDFCYRSGSSHDGRLICYLGEFAVALAEEPEAAAWLDYSNRGVMTVFPHWGGEGGGWNEGMGYALGYNHIHTPPMTTVSRATGFDLWEHPYFKKARYFFMYCVNLRGEIKPFGDGEQGGVGSGSGIASLLFFHANRYGDPSTKWFIRQFKAKDGAPPEATWRPALFVEDEVEPERPSNLPNDRAFPGIGWAALHSDLADPENDLHVMFKSSPYGSVSHSYADQNTFAIMKGGAALASLSGAYWPTYGAPFHARYTRHTVAKNGILVNGKGQIVRKRSACGELVDSKSTQYFGYACGDAVPAYGGLLKRFRRHVLMVRPNIVVVVDDLAAPKPSDFQWLFQARERLVQMNEETQSFVSQRKGERMTVHLVTPGGFTFEQTNEWLVDPTTGYEKSIKDRGGRIPRKQWHFTASTREKGKARRIAAIMLVAEDGQAPECEMKQDGDQLTARAAFPSGSATVTIDLSADQPGKAPILRAEYRPDSGKGERLSVQ